MPSIISAGTTTGTALSLTPDTSGELQIRTNNGATTAMTLTTGGNINIPTLGARITGDFSNATNANRVLFQTSTTNSATNISIIPNGTSPIVLLQCYNNSDPTNSAILDLRADSGDMRIRSAISGTGTYLPLTMYTGGSERLRITTGGDVGIGVSSPSQKLDVSGSAQLTFAGGNNYLFFESTNNYVGRNGTSGHIWLNTAAGQAVVFGVAATERMRIDSAGNVGIGTSSPTTRFNVGTAYPTGYNATVAQITGTSVVQANGTGMVSISSNDTMAADKGGSLGLGSFDSVISSPYPCAVISGRRETATAANYSGYFAVATTNNAGTVAERMRIDSSGNLLVGTTTANGRISSVSKSNFAPAGNAGTWATGPAISTSGGFGGGVSWVDGNGGYCAYVDTSGANFNIAGGLTSNSVANGVFLNGYSATSWSARSDERLKDKIESITNAVSKVNSLRAVTGVYKNYPDDRQAFLFAQDVQKVLPEAVSIADKTSPEQYLGLAYTQVIPLLVAAIKELKTELDSVKAELQTLKGK